MLLMYTIYKKFNYMHVDLNNIKSNKLDKSYQIWNWCTCERSVQR